MPSTQIPPGPRMPRPIQTLAWLKRPGPFMERCRDRYGDTFTLRIASEGTWVLMSDPEAVRQICSTTRPTSRSASSCSRPSTASA